MSGRKRTLAITVRCFALILTCAFVICMFCACRTGSQSASTDPGRDKTITIVTTTFPEYDWVREILGDNPAGAELTLLMDKGVDLHSYQPSTEDILKISTSDMFIYVGGESDRWVEGALAEAMNKNMVTINLLDTLGEMAKEEEAVEGMQEDQEHEEEHHEETEYDEHVWLSLRNASMFCAKIADALADIDPDNADIYSANAESYIKKLEDLDKEFENTISQNTYDTVLFGDRFPFRYLADDYGLSYYAAFSGCSAETEASFETITFLAGKVDELGLKTVLTIDGSDCRIAETIIENTASKDMQILSMDSMQSCTVKQIQDGVTYLSIMTNNLEVLKEALK